MEDFNKLTIEAYNSDAEMYTINTPRKHQLHHRAMLNWIDASLKDLNSDARVFEIGSATPRDATYMRSKGYFVQTSDASTKLIEYLNMNGEKAILFNALIDPIPQGYDLFFANAVVPHFTADDLQHFLEKVATSTHPGTRIAFNVKMGDGDTWINEKLHQKRFIHYWQVKDIEELIIKLNFKILFFDVNATGDFSHHHWVNIVLEKI